MMQSRMIALTLGIASVCFFPALPSPAVMFCLLVVAALLLIHRHKVIAQLLACYCLGVSYGVSWGYGMTESLLPTKLESVLLKVNGTIVDLPYRYFQGGQPVQRFELDVAEVDCRQLSVCPNTLRRLRLKYYGIEKLIPGQRWSMIVKLKRPHGMANPHGFDYESWLMQRGVSAVGYIHTKTAPVYLGTDRWNFSHWRWQFRQWLMAAQPELKNNAVIAALLWAERSTISPDVWQLFANTGTSHLMVISGLHIGLLAACCFGVLRVLLVITGNIYPERWAGVFAVFMSYIYAGLAGFSLPTQRALVMVLIFMASIVFQRQLRLGQGLLLALIICLLMDPLAPISASFWLSFTAVALILYVACGRLPVMSRWRQVFHVQWTIFIGLMPVLAIWMGQISLLAPLCNIIAVPLFGLLLIPGLMLAVLLSALDAPYSTLVWQGLDKFLGFFLEGLRFAEVQFEAGLLPALDTSLLVILLAGIGLLLLLAPIGFPARWLGIFLLLLPFFNRQEAIEQGDVQLTVWDVGQGLAVLVETARHRLAYDLGPTFGQQFSAVNTVLLPSFRARAIDHLDRLVISHSDMDHRGDWSLLMNHIEVGRFDTGAPDFFPADYLPQRCVSGQKWEWDGVRFEYLYPFQKSSPGQNFLAWKPLSGKSGSGKTNNDSCVLRIEAGEYRFLLSGDIERSVELALLSHYGQNLTSDILIAPHHGSLTSSSWPFVRTVAPDHVVFTVGYRNRFGHPRPEVLARYRHQGTVIHRSDLHGAITFRVKKGVLQPATHFRTQRKRYWQ